MKAVAITPAYSVEHPLLRATVERCGIPWLVLREHSDLVRVRSILLTQAVASGADRVILLDADTIPADDTLERLRDSGAVTPDQAVYGLYPLRDGARWQVSPLDPAAAAGAIERGESFDIEWGGLGVVAVHRESLLRLSETLPRVQGDGVPWQPWCLPFMRGSTYYAEDRALGVRLRDSGTRLLCDPTLRAAHAVTRLIANVTPRG